MLLPNRKKKMIGTIFVIFLIFLIFGEKIKEWIIDIIEANKKGK